jgi:dTDP-4-dehydrorhamnose reductase
MKRLIVLGATGMLGSEVVRIAEVKSIPVIAISRGADFPFDAESMDFEQVAEKLSLSESDWIVNCIGWIPQKSSGDKRKDKRLATLLNTTLPDQLSRAKSQFGFNWIQIATDGVYKGNAGDYSEADLKDAEDIYGLSKIAGEGLSGGAIQIRSSIVGRDARTTSGLYSWFKSAASKAPVNGYVNQHWNGVSTTAFAKLSTGMLLDNWTKAISQHWIPSSSVSKFELLALFGKSLGLRPGEVVPVQATDSVNRILATEDQSASDDLWKLAGYPTVPSIDDLCKEFIAADRKLGITDEQN